MESCRYLVRFLLRRLHIDFLKRLHDDEAFALELDLDAFAAAAAEEGFEGDVFLKRGLQIARPGHRCIGIGDHGITRRHM